MIPRMLMEPAAAREKLADFRLIDLRTREEHEAVAIAGSEFFTQELQQQLFAGDPETRSCSTITAAKTCSTKSLGSAGTV